MEMTLCGSCFQEYTGAVCPHCGGVQNEEHQLSVGTLLRDRYQIGRVLGQGGFGITYIAWDTLMQKCVAVKEFYPGGTVFRRNDLSPSVQCGTKAMVPHFEYSRERFLREARALVKFQSIPEIVDIMDFVKENNTAYIVMEYVRGVDLAKYIRRNGGTLTVQETFRILKPVMEALAQVHRSGIVHRDISPDNIILEPMGGAKLLDFGAVRTVENPDVEQGLNKSTEAILKHGFAPIEQYNSRGSLGPWTDEYAMCATVWYCLTGKIPTEASIRVSEGVDPDWSMIPGLPTHQQQALEKGFSCRAKDRFESMDAFLAAMFPEEDLAPLPVQEPPVFQPVKADIPPVFQPQAAPQTFEPVTPRPYEPVTPLPYEPAPVQPFAPVPQPEPKKKRSKGVLRWIIGIAAVLLLAVAAFFALRLTEPMRHYARAESLMEKGRYEEAGKLYKELGNYKNSKDLYLESRYMLAQSLLETGNHKEAIKIFKSLDDYEDSAERIPECNYAWGEALMAEGNYDKAADKFRELGSYEDSPAKLKECEYYSALEELGKGHYQEAIDLLLALDGYKDSADQIKECYYIWAESLLLEGQNREAAVMFSHAGAWRDAETRCRELWSEFATGSTFAAGFYHTVALRSDGTVVAAGENDDKQCNVGSWTDIVAVDAGWYHTVGLRIDGTVVVAGDDLDDHDVSGWTDIIAISAGNKYTVGLKADGTVVATGLNNYGQCDVEGWTDIIAISAGSSNTIGLKADGTVVATGNNEYGQLNVQDWRDIVKIYAGYGYNLGVKADGTILAVGASDDGRCDITSESSLTAIAAGYFSIGVYPNGKVVAMGANVDGECNVSGWTNIVAVCAGGRHAVGLRADGTLVAVGNNSDGQCNVSGWKDILIPRN